MRSNYGGGFTLKYAPPEYLISDENMKTYMVLLFKDKTNFKSYFINYFISV